ncbi:MAG: hypothetical protein V4534_03970 [Myxococcota bacterium]
MTISSKIKKSISAASLLALSSASGLAAIKTPADAINQLTGPNQPMRGPTRSLCVSVTPYFISGWGSPGSFVSLQMDGVAMFGQEKGSCAGPGDDGKCAPGFVKITSTAPIGCIVPVAL